MNITFQFVPNDPVPTVEEFFASAAPFTIGIDGSVRGLSAFNAFGPHLNINHHDGCARTSTLASCEQGFEAVRGGLFETFRDAAGPRAILRMDDLDPDSSLTGWLLKNQEWVRRGTGGSLLTRLVAVTGKLDRWCGMCPEFLTDMDIVRQLAWVFEPYWEMRRSGKLYLPEYRTAERFTEKFHEIDLRIRAHLRGDPSELPLDDGYDEIQRGPGWLMVRERGPFARARLAGDGVRTLVCLAPRTDDYQTYTILRTNPFSRWKLEDVLLRCNEAEGNIERPWGGGDFVIGSPKGVGSKLPPSAIGEIMTEVVSRAL